MCQKSLPDGFSLVSSSQYASSLIFLFVFSLSRITSRICAEKALVLGYRVQCVCVCYSLCYDPIGGAKTPPMISLCSFGGALQFTIFDCGCRSLYDEALFRLLRE